jgi:hypothetical protein
MKKLISYSFFISIFTTLISQVPQILSSGISSYLQFFWLLPLVLVLLDGGFRLNNFLLLNISIVLILSLVLVVFHVFGIRPYLDSPHLMNLYKSFLILIISFNAAHYLNHERLPWNLGLVSLIGGLILSISVYYFSFSNGFSVTTVTYAYAAKNSVSQIILTSIILVFILLNFDKYRVLSYFKYFFIVFGIYLLFILKSRATILGLVLAVFYILIKSDSRGLKLGLFTIVSLIGVWLYLNQEISYLIYNSILLGGRDGSNLNEASSGRLNFYFDFMSLFSKEYLLGYGFKFTESFPLSVLLDYGIIWSILVFFIVLSPFYYNYKFRLLIKNKLVVSFSILIGVYFLNSIFEQQAPIGPGSKNFFLWTLQGVLLQEYNSVKTIN